MDPKEQEIYQDMINRGINTADADFIILRHKLYKEYSKGIVRDEYQDVYPGLKNYLDDIAQYVNKGAVILIDELNKYRLSEEQAVKQLRDWGFNPEIDSVMDEIVAEIGNFTWVSLDPKEQVEKINEKLAVKQLRDWGFNPKIDSVIDEIVAEIGNFTWISLNPEEQVEKINEKLARKKSSRMETKTRGQKLGAIYRPDQYTLVKGHYRTINGKKTWVNPHDRKNF